jgi:phenylacetate-CoA ligase
MKSFNNENIFIDIKQLEKLSEAIYSSSFKDTVKLKGNESDSINRNDNLYRLRKAWDILLIKQTISYAYHYTPYYQKTWKDLTISPDDFNGFLDLKNFPILEKKDIVNNRDSFISQCSQPDDTRCTSGTTGKRLMLYGSSNEVLAMGTIIQARISSLEANKSMMVLRIFPALKRTLSTLVNVPNSAHTASVGHISYIFSTADQDKVWFDHTDHLVEILFEEYYINGNKANIELVHVTPPFLFDFISNKLISKNIDICRTKVKDVALSGGFVFGRTRKLVEDLWQAQLHTSFSCTEVNGECLECLKNKGVFHSGLTVYVEVVDTETLLPVLPGEHGLLVLTSYYPFQQVMPLIRYQTGDIVELIDSPCQCGDVGKSFRVIGRHHHCTDISDLVGHRTFIGPQQIGEVLSDFLMIPYTPYPRFKLTRQNESECVTLTLHVESNNSNTFDTNKTSVEIQRTLESACGELKSIHVGKVKFKILFLEKGSLSDFYRLYPER